MVRIWKWKNTRVNVHHEQYPRNREQYFFPFFPEKHVRDGEEKDVSGDLGLGFIEQGEEVKGGEDDSALILCYVLENRRRNLICYRHSYYIDEINLKF